MANEPIDLTKRSDGSASEAERSHQTIVMDQARAEQAEDATTESRVLDRLEKTSSLLDKAEADPVGDGEPSIEEYMAALIARTGGAFGSTMAPEGIPAVKSPSPAVPAASPKVLKRTHTSVPEGRDAISEMRELANISARSTFSIHRGQRMTFEMHGKMFVAMVAMVVSFALIAFAPSVYSSAFLGAVVALVTAMVWTVRYLTLARQLSQLCFARDSGDASDD